MDRQRFSYCLASLFILLFVSQIINAEETSDINKKPSSPIKKASTLLEKKSDTLKLSTKSDGSYIDTASDSPVKYVDFDEKKFMEELTKEEHSTNTTILNNTHAYYNSYYYSDPKDAMNFWIDLKSFNDSHFVHEVLSNSHRRAASISLPFNFSYYGNNLTRITVATGGFLYMGEHVHSWLAATQFVAPLMANFDTRNSSRSQILYGYNSSVFVVQWDNVMLQENPQLEFTFQCAIHPGGDIVFVYKHIPIPISEINEQLHPVKVGVSDAYFISRQHVFVRRKTIYEYHKIDILKTDGIVISNNTAIYLKAMPTCSSYKTCETCVGHNLSFSCSWCPAVQRCSDGYDRLRQEWISKRCDAQSISITDSGKCPAQTPSTTTTKGNHSTSSSSNSFHDKQNNPTVPTNANVTPSPTVFHNDTSTNASNSMFKEHIDHSFIHNGNNLTNMEYNTQEQRVANSISGYKRKSSHHSNLAIGLFCMLSIILGISFWIMYAYRNPTSTSGQMLIRWRPSNWRWQGNETRYTAASIHM